MEEALQQDLQWSCASRRETILDAEEEHIKTYLQGFFQNLAERWMYKSRSGVKSLQSGQTVRGKECKTTFRAHCGTRKMPFRRIPRRLRFRRQGTLELSNQRFEMSLGICIGFPCSVRALSQSLVKVL